MSKLLHPVIAVLVWNLFRYILNYSKSFLTISGSKDVSVEEEKPQRGHGCRNGCRNGCRGVKKSAEMKKVKSVWTIWLSWSVAKLRAPPTVDCWPSRNRRLIIVWGLSWVGELCSVLASGEGRVDLTERHCLSLGPQGMAALLEWNCLRKSQRRCPSREGSGNARQRRCLSILSNDGSENTRQRRCLTVAAIPTAASLPWQAVWNAGSISPDSTTTRGD